MPKIKPAPAAERRAFRKTLSPNRQPLFDELAGLIDQPHQDLDWYHRVGRLTNELRPSDEQGYHGRAWFVGLSEALGPGKWLFHKAVRFVELYPTKKDLQVLKDLGVEWTRLKLSFSIKNPKKRLVLLTQALKEKWSIARFHFEVQQRHPTMRRGVGGRPRRRLEDVGPEAALEELLLASRTWLHIHQEVWVKQSRDFQKQIKQLVRTRDEANGVLGKLKEACEKVGW